MSCARRITVVTVVRNGVALLEETILSVREQAGKFDIDHLVIDGASTDGTVDLIRRYADCFSYWVSEPDHGTYDAMNKGWAAADPCSFILFLGAGDRIISLPRLDEFDADEVVYGTVMMGKEMIFQPRADYHLRLYNTMHHQALLVPKALYPEPPFDTRFPVYADFDFNQRLAKSGTRFVFSPDLVGYAHPGGVSDRANFHETFVVIHRNYGIFWALLALSGYYAMKLLPPLRRLRPMKEG